MMRNVFATVLTLGGLAIGSASTTAQLAPGARSVGMGGGGMVFATGVDAIEWNPANLAGARGWNLSVFEVGIATMSSGATFGEIATIMGADLPLFSTDRTVAQIVSGIPDSGLQLFTVSEGFATSFATGQGDVPDPGSAAIPSIGFSIGSLGARIRSQVIGEATLSRELADLIGNGFVLEDIQNYAVGATGWGTTSFTEFTVAYGTTLGEVLSVGVAGRYVAGHGMTRGRFFEPEIDLAPAPGDPYMTLESVVVEAESGKGFGLDVGFSLDLPMGLRASVGGTNVLQRMTWDDGLVAHTATFTDQDFNDAVDFVDILDRYESSPVDPGAVPLAVYLAAQGLFDESYFPQVFRAGVGWRSGGTSVEAVGIKVSPQGRLRSAWSERLSLGVEHRLPLITVRAGYALGEGDFNALTGGLGLAIGPVHLEGSVGRFSSGSGAVATDGAYGTLALQLKSGAL